MVWLVALTLAGCTPAPGNAIAPAQPTTAAPPTTVGAAGSPISAQTLEQTYGVRVKLLAVTAAGGLVDLRLAIVDAAKAKTLLDNPDRFPTLRVGDEPVTLTAPEEGRTIAANLKDGGMIVILYPNIQGAVTPGAAVTVAFGDLYLAPISAM